MRAIAFAGICVLASMGAAGAATFTTETFTGDARFIQECQVGNGIGSGNQKCEFAVGELRIGNRATNGDWEVGIQNPPGSPESVQQWLFASGVSYDFSLDYVPGGPTTDNKLFLTVTNPANPSLSVVSESLTPEVDFTVANIMYIRASAGGTNDLTLANLTLNGMPVGSGSVAGAGGGGANAGYLTITNFDFTMAWSLAGDVTFTYTGTPSGSNMSTQFKIANQPVPLPPAGWMLLGALGCLYIARRRAAAG